jgi:hypothetical protein
VVAWDLAFHCAPLSLVDVDFAKEQIELLLRTRYVHPNGQIPAYEWNFSDVNPPVTPWAALYVYEREAEIRGQVDREFLAPGVRSTPHQLHLVRSTAGTRTIATCFRVVPRTRQHRGLRPLGAPARRGQLEQAGGTSWMALYCQWMLQIAVELSRHEPAYFDMALKFAAHFMWILGAMNPPEGDATLWDEHDGLYYDVMRMPDATTIELKVRSLVGLLPMCTAPCSTPTFSILIAIQMKITQAKKISMSQRMLRNGYELANSAISSPICCVRPRARWSGRSLMSGARERITQHG